jgi:hypothetical protein
MVESFDPFRDWLEIEPHEHPVDHYRLLGIRRFESNPEMIEAAADERMNRIRSYQTGPRGRLTQPILNAISKARLCLLDRQKRADYDHQLQGLDQLTQEGDEGEVTAEQSAEISLAIKDLHWTINDLGIRRRSRLPWISAVVVMVMVEAIGIGLWIRQRSNSDAEVEQEEPLPVVEEPPAKEDGLVVVGQEATGEVNLSVSVAEVKGENMQLDIARQQVHGWKTADDWVRWRFHVVDGLGSFLLKVEYAAEEQSGGGEFSVQLDDQDPTLMDVVSTGSRTQFRNDEKYVMIKSTGEHTLTLRARRLVGDELMVLRSIKLVPTRR